VLSMARTSVNDSATSQFFIMHETSPHLDGGYASFGGLISGFGVLDKIAGVETNLNDAPLSPVVIESITVNLNGYKK
ncbi:MAG: peptidylprolyl isomerase, partial [Acholeplasmataceae bacterium]|nr:peptidylprolyl isomerase [Acholeplasmataceae bacterium]